VKCEGTYGANEGDARRRPAAFPSQVAQDVCSRRTRATRRSGRSVGHRAANVRLAPGSLRKTRSGPHDQSARDRAAFRAASCMPRERRGRGGLDERASPAEGTLGLEEALVGDAHAPHPRLLQRGQPLPGAVGGRRAARGDAVPAPRPAPASRPRSSALAERPERLGPRSCADVLHEASAASSTQPFQTPSSPSL